MSAHGKHTKNPGYHKGQHWVTCDICGMDILSGDAKKRWDGLVVCPDDWDPRHPQDFVRVSPEDPAAKDPVRTPPEDVFASPVCSNRSGEAGVGQAGCWVVGQRNDDSMELVT